MAALALFLASAACGGEEGRSASASPTAQQPEAKPLADVPTATLVLASATPLPPTQSVTPFMQGATGSPMPSNTAPVPSPIAAETTPATSTAQAAHTAQAARKVTKTSSPPLSGGGAIAFQSDRDRQDEIYVMNADGSEQRMLITNPYALDSMPAWSPDGGQIALASRDRGKDFEICVVSVTDGLQPVEGKNANRLTENDWDDFHPTWSPDGTQIAFYSERDGYADIYVIGSDGTDERQLTDTRSNDKDPAWSPDGTQIAFVSRRDGDYEVYMMQSDGSDQRPLTDNDTDEWSPAWSPNGTQLAFASDRHGERHLYVIGADGSDLRRLTEASLPWSDDPAWSPDGTQIAFRSNRDGFVDVYVVSVGAGSLPLQLTHNLEIDQDRAPAWRPVPSIP